MSHGFASPLLPLLPLGSRCLVDRLAGNAGPVPDATGLICCDTAHHWCCDRRSSYKWPRAETGKPAWQALRAAERGR